MAEPTERDQFTDEEEDDFLEEEDDEQGLGSEDEEGGVGAKRKQLGKSPGVAGKRGVCYLSRVPPHMNPSHIRQMLSKYGEVLRIYLVPEGHGHRKHTTVKAKAYSEGWIEFAKKSVAKRVANLLNGEQIGGKKRSSFHYDIWNIKYLRKFKWDDLVGEMAEKTHIREQKLTLEIAAAKKQRDHYLSNVEKSRALKHIQERRKKKQKTEGAEASNVVETKTRPIPQKKPVGETDAKTKSKLSNDILAGVSCPSPAPPAAAVLRSRWVRQSPIHPTHLHPSLPAETIAPKRSTPMGSLPQLSPEAARRPRRHLPRV